MRRKWSEAPRIAALAPFLLALFAAAAPADPLPVALAAHDPMQLASLEAPIEPLASCVPTTCAANGFECGRVGDGCGGTLLCGSCGALQACGAAVPNVCGSTLFRCVPGNNTDLSADGCPCTGNVECEGVCPVGDPGTRYCVGGDSTDALPCAPGNGFDYSADGCPCTGNPECQGVCPVGDPGTRICLGGDPADALDCAPGNAFDYSANGCACEGNGECQGVCHAQIGLCVGGDPADAICAPGNSFGISPNGCPCSDDDECQNLCVQNECAAPEPGALVQAIAVVAAMAVLPARRRRRPVR